MRRLMALLSFAGASIGCASGPVSTARPEGPCGQGDVRACFALFSDASLAEKPAAATRLLAAADRACAAATTPLHCRAAIELRLSDRVKNPSWYEAPHEASLRLAGGQPPRAEDRFLPLDAPGAIALAERCCGPDDYMSWDVCNVLYFAKRVGLGGARDREGALRYLPKSRPNDPDPIELDPVAVEEVEARLYAEANAAIAREDTRAASEGAWSLDDLNQAAGRAWGSERVTELKHRIGDASQRQVRARGAALAEESFARGELEQALAMLAGDAGEPVPDPQRASLAAKLFAAFLERANAACTKGDSASASADLSRLDGMAERLKRYLAPEQVARLAPLRVTIDALRLAQAEKAVGAGNLTLASKLLSELGQDAERARAGVVASRLWLAIVKPLVAARHVAAAVLCKGCGLERLEQFPKAVRDRFGALRSEALQAHETLANEAARLGLSGAEVLHRRLARWIAGAPRGPSGASTAEQAAVERALAPTWSAVTVVAVAGSVPCGWLAEGLATHAVAAPWPSVRIELGATECALDAERWTTREPYTHQVTKRICHEEGGSTDFASGRHIGGVTVCDGSLSESVTESVEVSHVKTTVRLAGSVRFDGQTSGVGLGLVTTRELAEDRARGAVVGELGTALGARLEAFRVERARAEHRELELEHLLVRAALAGRDADRGWLVSRYGLDGGVANVVLAGP